MLHKLCNKCMRTCKQDSSVTIVSCPKYRKRVSDDEFRTMVSDFDLMESEAVKLKKRAKDLIKTALNQPETPELTEADNDDPEIESETIE